MRNTKHQTPNTREAPNSKHEIARGVRFEIWSLEFLWSLELGVWSFSSSLPFHPRLANRFETLLYIEATLRIRCPRVAAIAPNIFFFLRRREWFGVWNVLPD